MARELILKIKCDFCGNSIEEQDAHSGEVVLNGIIYHLDLCESDATELTYKLTPKPKSAPQAMVSTSKATPKADRNLPCQVCGVKCKNQRGLNLHMYKMHGVEPVSKVSRAKGHEGEPLK